MKSNFKLKNNMEEVILLSIVWVFAGYQIGYRVGFKRGDNEVFTDPNYHKKKLSKIVRSHLWSKYKFKSIDWGFLLFVIIPMAALVIYALVVNSPF